MGLDDDALAPRYVAQSTHRLTTPPKRSNCQEYALHLAACLLAGAVLSLTNLDNSFAIFCGQEV